jgi:hypothetical protein
MKLYSKSVGGFFDTDIHADATPTDAVEITPEEHLALLAGQAAGKLIVGDDSGKPMLKDRPAPTDDQVKAQENAQIIEKIKALEAGSQRALREALLGIGSDRLKAIDTQIAALRSSIK